ncbi:MAG: hypothetical protein Q7L55_10435 [Actinomycetota bacterium]|nr:hypothetical protein [Actinomycetota bacterium]
MQFLFNVLVVLHFVGLASLLGGFIVQMSSPSKGVNPAMLHGALTQLVTGVLMVGLVESDQLPDEDPLNMTKISVKLGVVLVITVLAFIGRKRQAPQVALWAIIGALTLLNVVVAVFWN